jgi:hypothetical protein
MIVLVAAVCAGAAATSEALLRFTGEANAERLTTAPIRSSTHAVARTQEHAGRNNTPSAAGFAWILAGASNQYRQEHPLPRGSRTPIASRDPRGITCARTRSCDRERGANVTSSRLAGRGMPHQASRSRSREGRHAAGRCATPSIRSASGALGFRSQAHPAGDFGTRFWGCPSEDVRPFKKRASSKGSGAGHARRRRTRGGGASGCGRAPSARESPGRRHHGQWLVRLRCPRASARGCPPL